MSNTTIPQGFSVALYAERALSDEGLSQLLMAEGWAAVQTDYAWDATACVWRVWVDGVGWQVSTTAVTSLAMWIDALAASVMTEPERWEGDNAAKRLTRRDVWQLRTEKHGYTARFWRNIKTTHTYHAVLELAKGFMVQDFDTNSALVGLPGCRYLDTTTGEIDAQEQSLNITTVLTDALDTLDDASKLWDNFIWDCLAHYTLEDRFKVKDYLQQWFGYALTGRVSNAQMLFIYGPPGTGKSTVLDTIGAIFGQYGAVVAGSRVAKEQSHSQWLAGLMGKRFVVINEMPTSGRWQTDSLNDFIQGGVVEANRMRQDSSINFQGMAHVAATGNDKPTAHSDNGIWRRLVLLQFTNKPDAEDVNLKQKLMANLPGVFGWMLDGLDKVIANDGVICVPAILKADTQEYRSEADPIKQYADECLIVVDGAETVVGDLYAHFSEWYAANIGSKVPALNTFGKRLDGLGWTKSESINGRRVRQGVGIVSSL